MPRPERHHALESNVHFQAMIQRQAVRRERAILLSGLLLVIILANIGCAGMTLDKAAATEVGPAVASSDAVQEVTELSQLEWQVSPCLQCGEDYMTLGEVAIVRCPECVDWRDA